MYKVEKLEDRHIEIIAFSCEKSQLQYSEYSFIDRNQLIDYFINKTLKSLCNSDTYSYVLVKDDLIKGVIICVKESFDSSIFGFGCYRITELLVFSETFNQTKLIIKKLLSTLEEVLLLKEEPVYLTFSLNNNLKNIDFVFNALVQNHYYYIHTLLTFYSEKTKVDLQNYYPEGNLKVREVNINDIDQVADLAQKSFKFSRFHLDPFLDDTKASILLKTSAINSIKNNFVDVMFVAEIENKVVGYYSAKKRYIEEFSKTVGEVVISAVDSNYRGLGIFSKLDSHILNWFSEHTDFSEMGTYLVNYPVHKTWINKGLGMIRGVHQFSKFIS